MWFVEKLKLLEKKVFCWKQIILQLSILNLLNRNQKNLIIETSYVAGKRKLTCLV